MEEQYYREPQVIDGELDGNQLMMHVEQGKYFGLNPVAKRIWDILETPATAVQITAVLLTEFKVDTDVCRREVQQFLDNAIKSGIISKKPLA